MTSQRKGIKNITPELKMEAAIKYMETGSPSKTANALGIKLNTLKTWQRTEWWTKALNDIRDEMNLQTELRLGKTTSNAIESLEDRLANGDVIYNFKTDTFKRVPVRAAVVNQILKNTSEQQQKLQQRASKEPFSDKAVAERLADLAQEFMRFAKAKNIGSGKGLEEPEKAPIDVEATSLHSLPKRI